VDSSRGNLWWGGGAHRGRGGGGGFKHRSCRPNHVCGRITGGAKPWSVYVNSSRRNLKGGGVVRVGNTRRALVDTCRQIEGRRMASWTGGAGSQ
jgi:hypothetical protein